MTWDEAYDLARGLLADPTSRLAAARAGWKQPLSREAMVLADIWDLLVAVNTDKKKRGQAKPYPRPFERKGSGSTRSAKPTVSQAEIDAALRARGYQLGEEHRGKR
jgi:hypothetical protein